MTFFLLSCEDSSSAAARVLEEIENTETTSPETESSDNESGDNESGDDESDDNENGSISDDSGEAEKQEYVEETSANIITVVEAISSSSTVNQDGNIEYNIGKGGDVRIGNFSLSGYSLFLKIRLEGSHAGGNTREISLISTDSNGNTFSETVSVSIDQTVEHNFDLAKGRDFNLTFDGGSSVVWIIEDIKIVKNN